MPYFIMNRLRNLIVGDPIALEKWAVIVDHIVHAESDKRRIKRLLKDHEYDEAVLETLNLWNVCGHGLEGLIEVLRELKLKTLADRLLEETRTGAQATKAGTGSGVWFGVGEVVPNFTGREAELQRIHDILTSSHSTESSTANIVSICGLGGVGKSTLARKYAFKYREEYDGNVMWINAETVDSVKASLIQLSTRLGLGASEQDSNAEIATRLYEKFRDEKSLFIFDNVEDKTHFWEVQPKIVNPATKTPYILVTTRRNDVTPLLENQISLGVMEMGEAVRLIRRQLPYAQETCAEKLAHVLERLPLALQQALAYILDKYTSDSDCISKYLKEFDVSEQTLLEDERFRENTDYARTTFTTWSVTLDRIKTMEGGEMAKGTIEALAYMNPDLITVQFLKNVLETTESPDMEIGLKLLERFSMLSVKDGKISIHRLVQQVIRLSLSSEQEAHVLGRVMEAIRQQLCKYEIKEHTRECASHGLKMFRFQLRRSEIMKDESTHFSNLCYFLIYYGNYSEALQIAEEASSVYSALNGEEHEDTLRMRRKTADALKYLDNHTKAMELLETILQVSNSKLGPEHWITMSILSSMAHIHCGWGDHRRAIQICDEIIPGQIKLYGKDNHYYVLSTQQIKAIALRKLGHLDEALELLQYVYEKRVELYGRQDLRTLTVLEHIGKTFIKKQEFSTAAKMLQEVYEGRKEALGETHRFTTRVKYCIEHAEEELLRRTEAQSRSRCLCV